MQLAAYDMKAVVNMPQYNVQNYLHTNPFEASQKKDETLEANNVRTGDRFVNKTFF